MDQLWKKVWAEFNWSQFGSSKCLKRSAEIAIITSWGSDKNLDGGFGQTRKQDERGSSITRAKLEETHTNWEYAGLTGSRLDGAEMLACGLATHFVSSDVYSPSLIFSLFFPFTIASIGNQGCRAILIDRDRNPKWEPSRLETIRDDDVDHYFSKIDDEDWEDLKLPPRSNMSPYAIAKL